MARTRKRASLKNQGASFLFLGLVTLGFATYSCIKSSEAQSWVSVPCNITSTHRRRGGTSVSYAYEFAGNKYTSTRVAFGMHWNSENYTRAFLEGRALSCFVDPKNPSEAVLERDISGVSVFLTVAFIVLGAGMMIRKRLSQKRAGADATIELPR
jgi:hypothetical protein